MKKNYFVFIFLASVNFLFSQNVVTGIQFSPVWASEKLEIEKKYTLKDDVVSISKLKFYVSDICFKKSGKTVFKTPEKSYLIDSENRLKIDFDKNSTEDFDEIQFNIGIDSLTNVSGAMGGDLDPVNGMYWSWQSGYINFKIEGNSERSGAVHKDFQFHVGGYLKPFETLQTVILPLKRNQNIIFVDVSRFLSEIDLNKTHSVMSTGENAVVLARQFQKIFSTDSK
ncbi:MbnP family protein [uncultured Chryseobacterium sp.]|uniref:MbnP family protein n=1 Tax=uncultured Chryseobacterium sp. TaxID=259322 RepID=UPI0027DBA2B3|nr:MbnP family protein [uncultured Chryseobacterium sp.]